MKEVKKEVALHSFYDRTGIVSYLEKQAEEGWLLEDASLFIWRFKRIEPRKLCFAVTYLPGASDSELGARESSLIDFCEHAGWKHAASNSQMQIFYSELENPVPIDTDAALEVEQIHASMKKSLLFVNALLILVGVFQLALFGMRMSSYPLAILTSNLSLVGILCALLVVLACSIEMAGYFRWLKRARAAAELDGSFVETRGPKGVLLSAVLLMLASTDLLMPYMEAGTAFTALAIALVAAAFAVVFWGIGMLLRKLRLSRAASTAIFYAAFFAIGLFVVCPVVSEIMDRAISPSSDKEPVETYVYKGVELNVYHDDIPLTVEDLTGVSSDDYSYQMQDEDSSLIAKKSDYSQVARWDAIELPCMDYAVSEVKAPIFTGVLQAFTMVDFVGNHINMELPDDVWVEAIEVDAAPWGADKAYQAYTCDEPDPEFLLYYGDRVVRIAFYGEWDLTDEQKAVVGEKLGLA